METMLDIIAIVSMLAMVVSVIVIVVTRRQYVEYAYGAINTRISKLVMREKTWWKIGFGGLLCFVFTAVVSIIIYALENA